jgi:hypothetical protein
MKLRLILRFQLRVTVAACALLTFLGSGAVADEPTADLGGQFNTRIHPLVQQYCLDCHSAKKHKGKVDLERFASAADIGGDLETWRNVVEMIQDGKMPPDDAPKQPTAQQKNQIVGWALAFISGDIHAHAGDPGRVIMRRLSNAEYDNTIHDLTGFDLQPAREFPADGAAGEGFTNAGDALVMSPGLLQKYLAAAKGVAEHAVLLPDGFRFAATTAHRDWTDQALVNLRAAYVQMSPAPTTGLLDATPFLAATMADRERLLKHEVTLESVAAKRKINAKYFGVVWKTLTDEQPSFLLDSLRERWRDGNEKDAGSLAATIHSWNILLWKFNKIGSYMSMIWQESATPAIATTQPVVVELAATPDHKPLTVYLVVHALVKGDADACAIWQHPRIEDGKNPPISLRDLAGKSESPVGVDPVWFGHDRLGHPIDPDSLIVSVPSVTEIHLPASIFHDGLKPKLIVDGKVDPSSRKTVVQFEVRTVPPDSKDTAVGGLPIITSADVSPDQLQKSFDAFRACFPMYLHHSGIIPADETINLREFFPEDGYLKKLFLDDQQTAKLDRLWHELIFVSHEPTTELKNYPTFLGFVSQDSPEALKKFKATTEDDVNARAAAFEQELVDAEPAQLHAIEDFAFRAYRRPLDQREKASLNDLYQKLRAQNLTHDEAFRLVLTRVMVSPMFLYRSERTSSGSEAELVSSWELASRLSYFLWATMPDDNLRESAASGWLAADPAVLTSQVQRMLKSEKVRGLSTEFATEWLHVHDIRENHEKNEKVFPTFDETLRSDMFEETVRFFDDMFQNDRSALGLIDADYTFLNELLAKHYGIPNVTGPEWRRVDGIKKYGRGGLLGMGSILAKQSGASRTSPTLRGNWLIETLLGERIPNPPANVPKLPEDESKDELLTVRQMVEKHARVAECAICHQRIDPFGMALESYDAIGRLRATDIAGHPVDCSTRLKDGTEINGMDGLRNYLLTKRKQDVLRNFSRKLVGYALGRSVTLSDEPLIDQMLADMEKNDYHVSAALLAITRSKQFRDHRALEATKNE